MGTQATKGKQNCRFTAVKCDVETGAEMVSLRSEAAEGGQLAGEIAGHRSSPRAYLMPRMLWEVSLQPNRLRHCTRTRDIIHNGYTRSCVYT
jgi:hypothetical protein